MNRRRSPWALLLAISIAFVLAAAACGDSDGGDTTAAVDDTAGATTTAGEPATTAADEPATTEADEPATTEADEPPAEEELPYGLLPGKPFDGTELTFLICCPAAAQFINWADSVDEFRELTGINVTFTNDPLGGLRERIVTESLGGDGAFDAVIWIDSWGSSLTQFLDPIGGRVTDAGLDLSDYFDASLNASTYDGELYGLPTRAHVFMFYYRQDVLDRLGIEVPTTWDELTTALETVEADGELNGITMNLAAQGGDQSLMLWHHLLRGNGTDFLDEGFRPIFNNPAGIEATEYLVDLIDFAPDGVEAYIEGDLRTSFAQGEAAFAIAWSWSQEIFTNPEQALPEVIENVGFTNAIPGPDGPVSSISMAWPIGISAGSNQKDAAFEWIKWMTNPDLELKSISDKSDPAKSTVVAARRSVLTSPEANDANAGFSAVMADAFENSSNKLLFPDWPEVNAVLQATLTELATGAEVQSTLDDAAEEIEAILDRLGYYN